MTELKQEVEIILTSKLKYHSGGEAVQATSVLLIAASSKQLKHAIVLKQTFFQAIASMQSGTDKTPAQSEIDMTGEDILSMLYMANVDVDKMMNSARELFKSGVAKIDGVQDFTDSLLDLLSVDDFEKLVGEYLLNFTLASALMKMKSSK